jgi:hypothetical protein
MPGSLAPGALYAGEYFPLAGPPGAVMLVEIALRMNRAGMPIGLAMSAPAPVTIGVLPMEAPTRALTLTMEA